MVLRTKWKGEPDSYFLFCQIPDIPGPIMLPYLFLELNGNLKIRIFSKTTAQSKI
jgi:hypothetical protein